MEQYSRVRTPKDNPNNERFNRTLQEEFIQPGNFNSDPNIFNRDLVKWLIEYNFKRPYKALNYQTPMKTSYLSLCIYLVL
ncbi:MAG: transposase [Candidatus Moranbacteria bacterium]|nr:transposase [Candidatus Moranbacteria bacterium]